MALAMTWVLGVKQSIFLLIKHKKILEEENGREPVGWLKKYF
jgi:hypothetical protein